MVWLVNSGDTAEEVETFLRRNSVELPSLLDSTGTVYQSYEQSEGGFAPYPFQVLIDQQGRIQAVEHQYDAGAMRGRIDALLGR